MPIYERSTAELMRQFVDERPEQDRFTSDEIVACFQANWPKIKRSTVQCHLIKMSTNARSRVHYSARAGIDDLLFQLGPGEFRRYDAARDPAPIYSKDQIPVACGDATGTEQIIETSDTFAYEHHLRDYLAKNLHVLEPGLRLYEDEGIVGIEFPIRTRRIDLLAVAPDGALVIIELKVSRGHDRTVGQLLTYMGWVRKDLADGRPIRGVIVANQISDELLTAVEETGADIRLFEYEMSFRVSPVGRR